MPSNQIPVIWHEGSLDGDKRSHYGNTGLLNEMFDAMEDYNFIHGSTFQESPKDSRGAVVVVHGGHETGRENEILGDVNTLKWTVIIVFGDEEGTFNTQMLQAPNRKLWQQTPIPGKHDFCDRFLICGYPCDTQRELKKLENTQKTVDWFFSGQISHSRRHLCAQFMQNVPNGIFNRTAGFNQGLARSEYFSQMAKAKIVPCPGGPATPDTIRLAEALESGCIPIADDVPGTRARYSRSYWRYVLKQEPPFPILTDWAEAPSIVAKEIAAFPERITKVQAWWKEYKRSMQDWLRSDIEELRKQCE
jgi:hypothetical protein